MFCWNVRGINDPDKQKRFKDCCHRHRPIFGCLLETHVLEHNATNVLNNILPGWNLVANYEYSHIGRIWVVSSTAISVMVYSKSQQHITCGISWHDRGIEFTATFVYGANLRNERLQLWDQIRRLALDTPLRHSPWMVLGDFNQTLLPSKHSIREEFEVVSAGSRELGDCLQDAELLDLPAQGPIFTWWNHQQANPIAEKLDRITGNDH